MLTEELHLNKCIYGQESSDHNANIVDMSVPHRWLIHEMLMTRNLYKIST